MTVSTIGAAIAIIAAAVLLELNDKDYNKVKQQEEYSEHK